MAPVVGGGSAFAAAVAIEVAARYGSKSEGSKIPKMRREEAGTGEERIDILSEWNLEENEEECGHEGHAGWGRRIGC